MLGSLKLLVSQIELFLVSDLVLGIYWRSRWRLGCAAQAKSPIVATTITYFAQCTPYINMCLGVLCFLAYLRIFALYVRHQASVPFNSCSLLLLIVPNQHLVPAAFKIQRQTTNTTPFEGYKL